MQIILLGPPGSGKGTQARLLSGKLRILHISTGDILREAVKGNTDTGSKAKVFLDKGELVPDQIILGMIKQRLGEPDSKGGFLLDGFPRTIPQAESLDEILKKIGKGIDVVVELEVSDNLATQRLLNRSTCTKCGANFNPNSIHPKVKGRCDFCGGELKHRTDDTQEVIKSRLKVYHQETEPIKDYYKKQGKLAVVGGEDGVGVVIERILKTLKIKISCSFK